jgi:hypothetical protein
MLVKNRSYSPRILTLPGEKGKTKSVALGARRSREIDDSAAASPELARLIASGALIVVPAKAAGAEKKGKKG